MKTLQLKDFLAYKFLNNVKISPDGQSCVFGVSVCDEKKNEYQNNLYLWYDGTCSVLTSSGKDSGALWLDNDTVMFRSGRSAEMQERVKKGEEVTEFYRISIHGGEAQKYFEVPLQVSKIEQLNEEEFLLQASWDKDYSAVGREDEKDTLLKNKKEEQDYEVFTSIPFCHNGGGYAKNAISRLYVYNVNTEALTAVSPENLDVASWHLKEDKSEVVITAEKSKKRVTMRSGLYMYHFGEKEWKELIREEEYEISAAFYFGKGILFLGNREWKHGYNENSRFFFMDEQKDISLFFDNTEALGNTVGSDCRYGGGAQVKVDGEKLYFITTREKDSLVRSLDTQGTVKDEIVLNGSVDCLDVKNGICYFTAMKDGSLQELYTADLYHTAAVCELTEMNEEVLAEKYKAEYQEVTFENDGISFKGWVLLPKDYDPEKSYPAILDIHGGPKTVYGTVFYHEMQLWANMGYFVFFTNPRGSDGRGNEFMDIFGKYGTIDYEDLMKFTDVVLETYPAIDKSRVGVTGGSYGGFMTNWIIGHTNRFACAATQRSISNWISFYGTSDIGMFFTEDQIHGTIFENPEKLWDHSPLKYAKNIETPTLFIHSDEDYRCPLEQGLQLYTAMVDREVEARFVLFHGENHELSRGGKPKHRVRRLEEITAWMEKYLK